MSHQPFETWLLLDEPLGSQQKLHLQAHLRECGQCRTLSNTLTEMDDLLQSSTSPSPAPGFTNRWYSRLSSQRQKRQQSRLWIFTLSLLGLGSLLTLVLLLHSLINMNWTYVFSLFIVNISLFAARVRDLLTIITSLIDAYPILVPITVVFGTGILSVMAALVVVWFGSIIRLYQPTQEGVTPR